MSALESAISRIGSTAALDRAVRPLSDAARPVLSPRPVRNLLSGTWLGHRLHPALVTVPIGALAGTSVLDVFGGKQSEQAADRLLRFGLLSVLPTAAAGLSDWVHTDTTAKRVGLVHALTNVVAALCGLASLAARRRGDRAGGTKWALAGFATVNVGGYLGGHLSYVMGVGVNQNAFLDPVKEWTPVLPSTDLDDGKLHQAKAGDVTVLLIKHSGQIFALADRCAHLGCSLAQGEQKEDSVVCRCHGSQFRFADGTALTGPAASSQPSYRTRVRDGMVEVRGG